MYEILNDIAAPWVRLQNFAASGNFTALFHLHSPYPHTTPASASSDEFAALADIRDTRSVSDGIIRVRNNADLSLEFASSRISSDGSASTHRYHHIGGDIELKNVTDTTAESTMRNTAATTRQFGTDAASAWIDSSGTRFRLPKLDPLYDSPFATGWARDNNLPTGAGRSALIFGDRDHDDIPDIIEFLVNGNPHQADQNPIVSGNGFAEFILNNQTSAESISFDLEISTDLMTWATHPAPLTPSPDQIQVSAGFTRMCVAHPAGGTKRFYRLRAR